MGGKGIYAGVSMIFLAYIGFRFYRIKLSRSDLTLKRTMPRGILGSLSIAIVLFIAVALVLVGMFHCSHNTQTMLNLLVGLYVKVVMVL